MAQLTPDGSRIVNDLSQRSGFSVDAVTHMLVAVLNGNGSMAQFSHPEFGGSGQWMQGGMSMIGDMFNTALKGRVDCLCSDIANIISSQPGLLQSGSFQSQNQSSGSFGSGPSAPVGNSPFFVPDKKSQWYPQELGTPNATGSQNNVRYAYFANARRLAVETGGDVWVYDTQDHQIGGFSQQQGNTGSIIFTSQYGTVPISGLPVVYRNGQPIAPKPPHNFPSPSPTSSSATTVSSSMPTNPNSGMDIFTAIERLGDLKAKGILTEEEYSTKKAELLARL